VTYCVVIFSIINQNALQVYVVEPLWYTFFWDTTRFSRRGRILINVYSTIHATWLICKSQWCL